MHYEAVLLFVMTDNEHSDPEYRHNCNSIYEFNSKIFNENEMIILFNAFPKRINLLALCFLGIGHNISVTIFYS